MYPSMEWNEARQLCAESNWDLGAAINKYTDSQSLKIRFICKDTNQNVETGTFNL